MSDSEDLTQQGDRATERRRTDDGATEHRATDELRSPWLAGADRRSGHDRRERNVPREGPERRHGERRRAPVQKAIQTAGKALETAENVVAAAGTVAGVAADAATNVVAKAGSAVGAVSHLAGSAATPITSVAERRRAEAARLRALRSRARQPLPSLWEVHPDARRAALRELGTQTVPIDRIVGTAVAGPTQRGGDFLPLPRLRGSNWESRWQRIRKAVDRLEPLPPVDLLRFGDEYWIVDGHNRVAAANYAGQVAIDGSVVDLRLPGMARTTPALVGAQLAEQRAFRDGVRRALQGGDRRESSEASQE